MPVRLLRQTRSALPSPVKSLTPADLPPRLAHRPHVTLRRARRPVHRPRPHFAPRRVVPQDVALPVARQVAAVRPAQHDVHRVGRLAFGHGHGLTGVEGPCVAVPLGGVPLHGGEDPVVARLDVGQREGSVGGRLRARPRDRSVQNRVEIDGGRETVPLEVADVARNRAAGSQRGIHVTDRDAGLGGQHDRRAQRGLVVVVLQRIGAAAELAPSRRRRAPASVCSCRPRRYTRTRSSTPGRVVGNHGADTSGDPLPLVTRPVMMAPRLATQSPSAAVAPAVTTTGSAVASVALSA